MRVFVAIDLPDAIRARLGELQVDLRPLTNSLRWVAPESVHVTLKFLGEVPETRIEAIDEAFTGLVWKPITINVHGVGFFPGVRSPRILWAGLDAPTMQELTEELDARMEPLGFDREKREFRPHITLARTNGRRVESALVAGASEYSDRDFGSFTADRIFLFQSTLKQGGPAYKKVKEYPLVPRSSSSR